MIRSAKKEENRHLRAVIEKLEDCVQSTTEHEPVYSYMAGLKGLTRLQ